MIYLDTSVALAQLLAEDRRPSPAIWLDDLIGSRLLEYELWTRVHARQLAASHGDLVNLLLARITLVEMVPPVLQRALRPFPGPVRTLDALHLSTLEFLRQRKLPVRLASYDERMCQAAEALGFPLVEL